jgi:phosphoribosyl 1,2-cyclic phosphodiesterase
VCKLPSKISFNELLPYINQDFFFITKTKDEVSIICPKQTALELQIKYESQIKLEEDWCCIMVDGLLEFTMIGVISVISTILAKAEISIFVLSTFNTDYILIKIEKLRRAITELENNGYKIKSLFNLKEEINEIDMDDQETNDGESWKMIFMGSGSSGSVPKLECILQDRNCVCTKKPSSHKNHRLNPGLILSRCKNNETNFNILVDIGKTFRESALKCMKPNNIKTIDACLITHYHMDAMGGIDDLREVQKRGTVLDVYTSGSTSRELHNSFSYLFGKSNGLYVASLKNRIIEDFRTFRIENLEITSIPLYHGPCISLGFVFRCLSNSTQVVYFSDFRCKSSAPPDPNRTNPPPIMPEDFDNLTFLVNVENSLEILRRHPISYMILDCLHPERTFISHSNLVESIGIIKSLQQKGITAKKYLMTGMSCSIDYVDISEELKRHYEDTIQLAYDGAIFNI